MFNSDVKQIEARLTACQAGRFKLVNDHPLRYDLFGVSLQTLTVQRQWIKFAEQDAPLFKSKCCGDLTVIKVINAAPKLPNWLIDICRQVPVLVVDTVSTIPLCQSRGNTH